MVVDTSVLAAIAFGEAEAALFDDRIRSAETRRISAASCVELATVLSRRLRVDAPPVVRRLLDDYELQVVDVDGAQMGLAMEAVIRFGKGRHPARLNFGDCFSYALARSLDMPLLFKGEDFTHTDLTPAI